MTSQLVPHGRTLTSPTGVSLGAVRIHLLIVWLIGAALPVLLALWFACLGRDGAVEAFSFLTFAYGPVGVMIRSTMSRLRLAGAGQQVFLSKTLYWIVVASSMFYQIVVWLIIGFAAYTQNLTPPAVAGMALGLIQSALIGFLGFIYPELESTDLPPQPGAPVN